MGLDRQFLKIKPDANQLEVDRQNRLREQAAIDKNRPKTLKDKLSANELPKGEKVSVQKPVVETSKTLPKEPPQVTKEKGEAKAKEGRSEFHQETGLRADRQLNRLGENKDNVFSAKESKQASAAESKNSPVPGKPVAIPSQAQGKSVAKKGASPDPSAKKGRVKGESPKNQAVEKHQLAAEGKKVQTQPGDHEGRVGEAQAAVAGGSGGKITSHLASRETDETPKKDEKKKTKEKDLSKSAGVGSVYQSAAGKKLA